MDVQNSIFKNTKILFRKKNGFHISNRMWFLYHHLIYLPSSSVCAFVSLASGAWYVGLESAKHIHGMERNPDTTSGRDLLLARKPYSSSKLAWKEFPVPDRSRAKAQYSTAECRLASTVDMPGHFLYTRT